QVPASNLYLSAGPRPYMGVRGHFYVEVFPRLREEMRKRGVSEGLWRHYTPYPTWTPPPFERAPQEYDLYLMDFKRIEHKHSRSVSNALLQELLPANPLVMNTKAARERGLRDGDGVWVESIDPLSGEKRRVTTTLATTELIRPDTVALTHHVSRLTDPNVNSLIPFGEGFWDMGGGWFSHIRVKVWKAEQAKGA
ncbi:MAG: hypothetical protein HY684_06515, partial [Chloroflexi bacterium]|nr:hypothetical protein [Chloroflexota bacterium]